MNLPQIPDSGLETPILAPTHPRVRKAALKRVTITSAAWQTADRIVDEILAYEGNDDEWLLGSEDELMRQLGIGRPTIRQAARLLEQQQLLTVRRGPRGGLFARRPTGEGVTGAARVFLQSQDTTFRQLLEVELVLSPVCAARAAANPDIEARTSLLSHYDELSEDAYLSTRRFMELARDFQRRVAELSQSPVLFLFVSVLMDLAAPSRTIERVFEDESQRRAAMTGHRRIALAIVSGDGPSAARRMERHVQTMLRHVDELSLDQPLDHRRQ
jgi:DNA-binding FadR family transcriptional regulator